MVFLVTMAILVALSDLFGPEAQDEVLSAEENTPIYIALLYCFIYPVVATLETFFVTKYTFDKLRIGSTDFAEAFLLIYSVLATIVAVIYFSKNEERF